MSRIRVAAVMLALFIVCACASLAQDGTGSDPSTKPAKPDWPRSMAYSGGTIQVYQPQLESWISNVITARCAVMVAPDDAKKTPKYGIIKFSASTDVNKDARVVTLSSFNVIKSDFPGSKDGGKKVLSVWNDHMSSKTVLVPLDSLQTALATATAKPEAAVAAVRNPVPNILVQSSPSMLVRVHGDPSVQPISGSTLQRIMNTPALLVQDPASGTLYLYLSTTWVQSNGFNGPWTLVAAPPPGLATSLNASKAKNDADLFTDAGQGLLQALNSGNLPNIYVVTTPSELIVTTGPPALKNVPGTSLQWVSNTQSDVFFLASTNAWYVLLSGRWFSSPSLTNGPWAFVPGTALPTEFSNIPTTFERAAVLVSVPNSPQAREAVIANSIAQTASLTIKGLTFTTGYDQGQPNFQPIDGTSLQYAVNSRDPVIMVSAATFYALKNGVWFTASSASGPWSVATSVPDAIYAIPPSSPLYYVTYVRIYKYTDDTITVGYTPGYFGSLVSQDGTVVYGTGYPYPTYVGTDYVVYPPYTYGAAAAYAWGTATGFILGETSAWWGPGWGWGWGGAWGGWGWGGAGAWGASSNVYGHWGNVAYAGTRGYGYNAYTGNYGTGVRGTTYNTRTGGMTTYEAGRGANAYTGGTAAGVEGTHYNPRTGETNTFGAARVNDNVYAGRDGNVYRDAGGGWQKYNNGSWNNVNADQALHNDWASRTAGYDRMSNFDRGGWGGGFHGFGGGFRGFGGFRR